MPWVIGSIISAAVIVVIEWKSIKQRQLAKERWIFIVLLVLGIGLGTVLGLHLSFPNSLDLLAIIYQPFWAGWMKLFG